MHQPRSYGRLGIGDKPTARDDAAIELLARRLTNLKDLSGVASLRFVHNLPDGGYVVLQDMGGVFRAITHKVPDVPEVTKDFVAQAFIPMLYSGVITNARPLDEEDAGVEMLLSDATRLRLVSYDKKAKKPKKRVELQRFKIEYGTDFLEFLPKEQGIFFHTQYYRQRPTWYSGAMAEVMQIVGGYGRQDVRALPEDPIERAVLRVPKQYLDRILQEIDGVRLPAYSGLPPLDGKFQYDYKFNKTHGVGFDEDGKPWLLQIGFGWVWAMPFPVIPATTTEAFREYMEEVDDQEILKILDRFGGMPSGESFPRGEGFEAWRRAGVIIKVCSVKDFYGHSAYSTACGWSINESGNSGINTCFGYENETGIGYGLAYGLRMELGRAENHGWQRGGTRPSTSEQAAKLQAYIRGLRDVTPDKPHAWSTVIYKICNTKLSELMSRAQGSLKVGESEYRYWYDLEHKPIAEHVGEVNEIGRGYLYHPNRFESQPQIKFPEPLSGGCVSHNFSPLMEGRAKEEYPNCDTIMFGYYVGDDLQVVKYFRDGRTFKAEVEGDFEECMTVGSWTQVETTSPTGVHGNFYTSSIDLRQSFAASTMTTKIVGRDKGFAPMSFSFDAFYGMWGTIWHERYYTHQVNQVSTDNRILSIGVCIPYFNRNAILHAELDTTIGKSTRDSLHLYSVQDPTTYRYWTFDRIFAFVNDGDDKTNTDYRPFPEDGNPVWVVSSNYQASPCSDFADSGGWMSVVSDVGSIVHPNSKTWIHSKNGKAPQVKQYSNLKVDDVIERGGLRAIILNANGDFIHAKKPNYWYFSGSPEPFGEVFYRDACKVCFGDSIYANVSELVGERRKHWGYSALANHDSAHHFIGVINE